MSDKESKNNPEHQVSETLEKAGLTDRVKTL